MKIRSSETWSIPAALLTGFLLLASSAHAQNSDLDALSSWIALDAPTGHEHLATDLIEEEFSGWDRERNGSLSKTIGSGEPWRVVACALDSYSYAVSQITEDGYLRLHRIGRGSGHPLWDQSHEGQQLRVLTRGGPVVGVSAVANGHFAAQHRLETAITTENDLWLDVGAESAEDVATLGISLLDPVLRHIPAWSYANEVAGPRAGARVGCAAVLAAAEAGLNGDSGSTKYVLSTQQNFGWLGLGGTLSSDMRPQHLIVLAPGQNDFQNEEVDRLGARVDDLLSQFTRTNIRVLAPKVSGRDALMERVELDDAEELLAALVASINPQAGIPDWQSAPTQLEVLNDDADRWGQGQNISYLMEIEGLLDQVAEKSAVPGHEGPVRNIIYNAMPDWAQDLAQVDDLGNMWLEFGPVSELTVFIAHMDEVGYWVESIDEDGIVNLQRRGGVVTTAWEGQPAVLQLDPNLNSESLPESPSLRGVFLSRERPAEKQPDSVRAWFGMNRQQLAAAGVVPEMGLTLHKEGHRMGAYRYAARSLDDRVGTTSLLMALHEMDPAQLDHRVVFAWSVREEGGLVGAAALAKRLGQRTRRVYSIDTFVSSQTPLESPHFAFAPLGSGPVLRSVESAGMATPSELDRNRRIAEEAGIDFQIGLTQGSTDGTTFTPYGAPNAGLSWPGRYSHSPAEIADLRDVAQLIELIKAMAEAPLEL